MHQHERSIIELCDHLSIHTRLDCPKAAGYATMHSILILVQQDNASGSGPDNQ